MPQKSIKTRNQPPCKKYAVISINALSSTMANFLSIVAKETEENANEILQKDINFKDDLKETNLSYIREFLDSEANLSINSSGNIFSCS